MATLFRATVMLAVLVGGPAAWIYYGPLPPPQQATVNRVIGTLKAAWSDGAPSPAMVEAPTELAAAPAFGRSRFAEAAESSPPEVAPHAAERPTLAEQVEPLLEDLRQQGAAEYSLEQWGSSGQLFRFCCAMPLAGVGDHCRQFEAIGPDPRAAVAEVVAEASAWQDTRREGWSR